MKAMSPDTVISSDITEMPHQLTVESAKGRLRNSPSFNGDVIAVLKQYARATVHAIQGDWFLIETPEGKKGWAHRSLFKLSSPKGNRELVSAKIDSGPFIQGPDADRTLSQPSILKPRVAATALVGVKSASSKDETVIHVEADGALENYKSFTLTENPPRIVFDFPGIHSAYEGERRLPVKTGPVSQVRHLAYPEKIRLVIETQKSYLASYTSEVVDNGILVRLGDAAVDSKSKDLKRSVGPVPQPAEPADEPSERKAGMVHSSAVVPASLPPEATMGTKRIYIPPKTRGSKEWVSDSIIRSSTSKQCTLNFVDTEVRELLSALAISQEVNIVTAPDVTGRVSVHLNQAPLDKVIGAISQSGGFGYRKLDDVYYVYKPKGDKDPQSQWLQLRTFKLNYIDTDKIQDILKSVSGIRMIQLHEPSKTIIVEDTQENIQRVEALIRAWDTKPQQVMIEAKILEIRLADDMVLGVDWAALIGGVRLGTGGFSRATLPSEATGNVSPAPVLGSGIFGNLLTGIGPFQQFAMALDALKAKTNVNVLSTPKLLALNGKSASVQVGGQQGYKVTTTNLGVVSETIKFIDTGTILHFTPYIDEDNNILLNVMPTISSATLDQGIPVVRQTTVSTWLLAKNGETIFIGGLIQENKLNERSEIPGLGQLPIIGPLFGRTNSGLGKTELVVLITPRILSEDALQHSISKKEEVDRIQGNLRKEQRVFEPESGQKKISGIEKGSGKEHGGYEDLAYRGP
jgi:type IV pilus assembly protein PilQ